jgi:hypothetical protein
MEVFQHVLHTSSWRSDYFTDRSDASVAGVTYLTDCPTHNVARCQLNGLEEVLLETADDSGDLTRILSDLQTH